MKRLLRNFLTALSLLVFLLAAALLIRSLFAQDIFILNFPGLEALDKTSGDQPPDRETPHILTRLRFVSSAAGLNCQWAHWIQPGWDAASEPMNDDFSDEWQWCYRVQHISSPRAAYPLASDRTSDIFTLHFPGFQLIAGNSLRTDAYGSCRYLNFTFPLPLLAILAAILPARFFLAWRRRRRAKFQNLCPICRYDLRAHKPGDKCPECGTPIPIENATIPL